MTLFGIERPDALWLMLALPLHTMFAKWVFRDVHLAGIPPSSYGAHRRNASSDAVDASF